ncbi:MAG: ThiF family adenylyltransferase [bacterium]
MGRGGINLNRYTRIARLSEIGAAGLEKLSQAKVALVGCGTLGGAYALHLVRLGVAALRLIDRDIVEVHNLPTQFLFDEADCKQVLPKAIAAQQHLQVINSRCLVEALPVELRFDNAEQLLSGVDVILDGTDNFETRFLINEVAVKNGIPWVYTGVVGFTGLVMAIVPQQTACLNCLLDEPPAAGALPTCETMGVWAPAAHSVAALGLTKALRILLGQPLEASLTELDLDAERWRKVIVKRKPECRTCGKADFIYLNGKRGFKAMKLCGRDMVHLSPEKEMNLNLPQLAKRFESNFSIQLSEYLLHLKVPEAEISIFPDGRALIKGISDPVLARSIFNRYIST